MRVVVEILTGTVSYIDVGDDANVRELKTEIAAQTNLPYERLILLLDTPGDYECHLIEDAKDEALLIDVGVNDGARIYLFFKPLDFLSTRDDRTNGNAGSENSRLDDNHDQIQPFAVGGPSSPPLKCEPSDIGLVQKNVA
ncbi:uncharacterized protein LOC116215417 [Punica granatum]|uniref:Ubiquitin-like domain-containing protein n=2 Tax=Punica granatum TaxID=22663 RepID=A0A218VUU1_PUNGR|nr:uncharacterized protein LOC116215417 [Punica granatum]OWM64317.1 hypothetical protein CDL15_Pgr014107 [Punica granatum]PKI57903.1 hypothetical protein CRG98_021691 [Punica granatum]